jgi:hypothetical protein
MASGLQCLAAAPPLVQSFLSRPSAEKENMHSLTDQFASLLQKMWSGKYRVLRPVEFKQALGYNYPQFKDFRQVTFISGLRRNVDEIFALLGYYAASCGNCTVQLPHDAM